MRTVCSCCFRFVEHSLCSYSFGNAQQQRRWRLRNESRRNLFHVNGLFAAAAEMVELLSVVQLLPQMPTL